MPVEIWPVEITGASFRDPEFSCQDEARLILRVELATINDIDFAALAWDHLGFFLNA